MTVNLLQLSSLARPLLTQCPSALLTAARQQWQRGANMINNDWQALGVGLLDTWEIVRIITSNTTRIDLPMWLRLEHQTEQTVSRSWTDLISLLILLLSLLGRPFQRSLYLWSTGCEVNSRPCTAGASLVLGWVTILVCDQSTRWTQPSIPPG